MNTSETHRGLLKSDRWEEWRGLETDQRKDIPVPSPQKPCPGNAVLVELASPSDIKVGTMPLIEAIRKRRSCRKFTAEPLTVEELSFLLWATQGIDNQASQAFGSWIRAHDPDVPTTKTPFLLRTVPSAGARHPFETYLLSNRVNGLKPGLYRYLAIEHKLLEVDAGAGLAERSLQALAQWVRDGAVVFVWTAVPYRTEWRYSMMSYKMIAQESGHVCQNLYLASVSIGAGVCAIGAYDQAKADAMLGVDGTDEFAIYMAVVGKISQQARYHFGG